MDRQQAVHVRKKRYMGRLLGEFERLVEPHLPPDVAVEYKGQVRAALNGLTVDCCEIFSLKPDEEQNGYAAELRERFGIRTTTRSKK